MTRVHVLGLPHQAIALDDLGLEVLGEPHHTYDDKHPLPSPPGPSHARRIVMAHGHYVSGPHDLHRAWLIRDEDIAALGADYVALGHWDRRERVGRAPHFAHYSGSPDLARSINIARFSNGSGATVVARSLHDGREDFGLMRLAKEHIDVGTYTNNAPAMLRVLAADASACSSTRRCRSVAVCASTGTR